MAISYPEDEYIDLVGRLAYTVTYLEGLVLYDLPRLNEYLPSALAVEKLIGQSTGTIGNLITGNAQNASHPAVVTWLVTAGGLLSRAAKIRNPVLHARPAIVDNKVRLVRWIPGELFPITVDHLRRSIAEIEDMVRELSDQHLSFQTFPLV